jgi:hypothetical protein
MVLVCVRLSFSVHVYCVDACGLLCTFAYDCRFLCTFMCGCYCVVYCARLHVQAKPAFALRFGPCLHVQAKPSPALALQSCQALATHLCVHTHTYTHTHTHTHTHIHMCAGPQSPTAMYSPIQSPFNSGGVGFSPGPGGMFSPGPQSPGYSPTSPRYTWVALAWSLIRVIYVLMYVCVCV